jgi:hypothetical protein
VAVEPASVALDEKALLALGLIAVQAARLEWFLVGLHAICDKSRTHEQHLKEGRPAEHAKAIAAFLEPHRAHGPIVETIWWADEAVRLLKQRGDLMHSGWVVNDEGNVQSHHMRSGDRRDFSQVELDDLATRLGVHVAAGPAYWTFVILIVEDRLDLMPTEKQ